MTGYDSKRAAARDKLITVKEHGATKYAHLLMVKCFTEEYDKHRRTTMDEDDDTQVYQDHDDALTIAYQSGYYDGKKAAAQEPWRESASDYERGVIDGRQMQAQSSVDKAVNAMTQRPWVGLTDEERKKIWNVGEKKDQALRALLIQAIRDIEDKLKEKNNAML